MITIMIAANKLITDNMQNIYLTIEHSGFMKYSLNYLNLFSSKLHREKYWIT